MILSFNAPAIQAIPDPTRANDIARRAEQLSGRAGYIKRPDRYQALAALPMQDPDLAVDVSRLGGQRCAVARCRWRRHRPICAKQSGWSAWPCRLFRACRTWCRCSAGPGSCSSFRKAPASSSIERKSNLRHAPSGTRTGVIRLVTGEFHAPIWSMKGVFSSSTSSTVLLICVDHFKGG